MLRYSIVTIFFLIAGVIQAQPGLSFHASTKIETRGITAMAFSGNEQYLAVGTNEGKVYLLDTESATVLETFSYHDKAISGLIFDGANERLFSGSLDKNISIWSVPDGTQQQSIKDTKIAITALALSPDEKTLVACGSEEEIFCWDIPSGHFRGKLEGHADNVIYVAFGQNDQRLLSVGEDNRIIFWNLANMQSNRVTEVSVTTMKNSGIDVTAAICSYDRRIVVVAVEEHALQKGGRQMKFERSVAFYDWETGSRVKVISGNQKKMELIRLTPQTGYFISDNSSMQETQLSFWDTESGVVESNSRMENAISGFELSRHGHWLASSATVDRGRRDSYVTLWTTSGIGDRDEFDWTPDILSKAISLNDTLPLLDSGAPKSLAVLYFAHNNVEESISRSTTGFLENQLFNSPHIRLLERNQIDKIVDELNLAMSGLTDSMAVRIGRLAEAEYILVGSVDKIGNELHVTARLVHVNSGQIKGIREATCTNASLSDISAMVKKLAPAIAKMR